MPKRPVPPRNIRTIPLPEHLARKQPIDANQLAEDLRLFKEETDARLDELQEKLSKLEKQLEALERFDG